MKEEALNKLIEDINDAFWHLKNDKCNVDTKEKGWEAYYGLDDELINYIRKIEKTNVDLQFKIDKAIKYVEKWRESDGSQSYCACDLLDILKGEINK